MKLLLVDDHSLFLDGIKNLLLSQGMEVAGTAHDGWEAVEQARALRPDVILMDVQLPKLDGLAATRLIKAEMPEVKVVMLTMDDRDETLFEAIKSGASGFLLKTEGAEFFFKSLRGLSEGESPLSSGVAARILKEFGKSAQPSSQKTPAERLSAKQLQVLTLVAGGLTYKEVGARLFLSERTIKYHMAQIVQQLQLENRAQALEYAQRIGLPHQSL